MKNVGMYRRMKKKNYEKEYVLLGCLVFYD